MHPFIYSLVHCLRTYCVLDIVLSVLSALSTLLCSWDYTSTFQMRNSSEESSDLPKITQPGLEEGWTESSSNSPPGKCQRHGLSSPEALVLGESGPRTLSTQHNSKSRQQQTVREGKDQFGMSYMERLSGGSGLRGFGWWRRKIAPLSLDLHCC